MLASGAINAVLGTALALRGAWPAGAFLGLASGLLYLAFRLNYRAARIREEIVLSGPELRVTRLYPSGRKQSWIFNPYWVRLQHVRRAYAADELSLTSHGRKLVFGAFLSDIEKEDLAAALNEALSRPKPHSSTHSSGM